MAAVCLAAALAGCAGSPPRPPSRYVVRPHDTLYSIAWRNRLDYRDLAAWNHLGAGDRIEVGQVLVLRPPAGTMVPRRPAAAAAVDPRLAAARRAEARARGFVTGPAARGGGRATPAAPLRSAAAAALRWNWPTAGQGSPHSLPNGALVIPGRLGQDVRAAAAGRVVYTGSGIRGFGELVIIKHTPNVLSAYAYNASVAVREGEQVAAGQTIASMGRGEHGQPMLYFEIRADGRTVDPTPYLPRIPPR